MTRSVTALAVVILSAALAGCSIFAKEEHKDWTAEQFYKAAKEQLDQHNWESSSKLYEQLESKFPYGRFAQQAREGLVEPEARHLERDREAQGAAGRGRRVIIRAPRTGIRHDAKCNGIGRAPPRLRPRRLQLAEGRGRLREELDRGAVVQRGEDEPRQRVL